MHIFIFLSCVYRSIRDQLVISGFTVNVTWATGDPGRYHTPVVESRQRKDTRL